MSKLTKYLKWISCPECDRRDYEGAYVVLGKCKDCGYKETFYHESAGYFGTDGSWNELGATW